MSIERAILWLEQEKANIAQAALERPNADRDMLFEYGRNVGKYAGIALAIDILLNINKEDDDDD